MTKASQLKTLIRSDALEFILEAHNGVSAKIVEEAGFAGIWASGLTLSASLGVRDSNEASWTQLLEMLEFMSDATNIPILFDADTGFGNFNNVRRLVRKLEQRGIGGMCIEDKMFPKTNSLIDGKKQVQENVDVFAGKIKAAKDTQRDADFCVVARIESFIAGAGLADALTRATAYHAAGADAILIHSKEKTANEVVSFKRKWKAACPVVIVPTAYCQTPTDALEKERFSVIIWANHLLRSAITAMRHTAKHIRKTRSVADLQHEIATVKEVFQLQNQNELFEAEKKYQPGPKVSS